MPNRVLGRLGIVYFVDVGGREGGIGGMEWGGELDHHKSISSSPPTYFDIDTVESTYALLNQSDDHSILLHRSLNSSVPFPSVPTYNSHQSSS